MTMNKRLRELWLSRPKPRWELPTVVGVLGVVCLAGALGVAWLLDPARQDPLAGRHWWVVDSVAGMSVLTVDTGFDGVEGRARYFRDESGIRPLDIQDLSRFIAAKHGAAPSDRAAAIRDFVRLYNAWETVVLASAQDIPGFSADQLDPDLRLLPLAPIETQRGPNVLSIVYTWTRIGGILARYRFHSAPGQRFSCLEIIELEHGLGHAAYLL